MSKLRIGAYACAFLVIVMACLAGAQWWTSRHQPQAASPPEVAERAPVVESAKKIDVSKPLKLKVYKPEVTQKAIKANLIPPKDIDIPKTSVVESTEVKAGERPQVVTTVVNTDTGETKTFTSEQPHPWIALESRGSLALYYGLKTTGFRPPAMVGRLELKQDFMEIKGFHLGGVVTADTDRELYAGVGVSYRW